MKNLHLQLVLAFFAGWVNRSQQSLIEYLKTENEIYREKHGKKRIRFTDGLEFPRLSGYLKSGKIPAQGVP